MTTTRQQIIFSFFIFTIVLTVTVAFRPRSVDALTRKQARGAVEDGFKRFLDDFPQPVEEQKRFMPRSIDYGPWTSSLLRMRFNRDVTNNNRYGSSLVNEDKMAIAPSGYIETDENIALPPGCTLLEETEQRCWINSLTGERKCAEYAILDCEED